ncbi:MAG: DUF3000 domain-containing protein [Nocardioides sp.]
MGTRAQPDADMVPAEFTQAVEGMRRAVLRPELSCEEMPAPQRIAPYAAALTADISAAVPGSGGEIDELGTGRIILLHDPAGNDAWQGEFRCVAYVRADLEPEEFSDEVLAGVAWSWLVEALESNGAQYLAPSGTVTVVGTTHFGGMADQERSAQVEVRASWTPVSAPDGSIDAAAHVEAWGELMCSAAGLEPMPEGVTAMPSRRGQRGR